MDTDVQVVLIKEEPPEDQTGGVDQQDPEHLHVKEEQKQLWISHLRKETDTARFLFSAVSTKSEDDEENPLFSQLHQQQQMEDRDVPTSSSVEQMSSEMSGKAETSRNPDLNHHEQASDSLETQVSGDYKKDYVNLDPELSDAGREIEDGDNDWNESRSSDSNVKIVIKSSSFSEFLHKWFLQKHVRVTGHSKTRSLGCLVNKNCVNVSQHVESSMNVQNEPKSFSCDDCGKIFSQKTNLNRHMRVHTGQKPFACELCGHKFWEKTPLKSHMSIHTGQKPFACELCGQKFREKSHLNNHMSIHTGQKPFTCELCGQRFSRKSSLRIHMRVHTGQKPFTCELCGQKCSQKTHLNTHMRIHTGQKPFACELCGQKFSQKTHLNAHMRVHTGQKPFACELCEQKFSQKSSLNTHMRIHTGQKPFACELCGQTFSQKTSLNKHMRVHKEQKEHI